VKPSFGLPSKNVSIVSAALLLTKAGRGCCWGGVAMHLPHAALRSVVQDPTVDGPHPHESHVTLDKFSVFNHFTFRCCVSWLVLSCHAPPLPTCHALCRRHPLLSPFSSQRTTTVTTTVLSPPPRHPHGVYGHYLRWHWHSLLLQHRSIPRATFHALIKGSCAALYGTYVLTESGAPLLGNQDPSPPTNPGAVRAAHLLWWGWEGGEHQ
jgi:hypothetical protein